MGKYKRLGKNTIIVFAGNAGGKLISLLMLPFYTRWLSVSDYGLTDILGVYAAFLLGIISCCISDAIFVFPKGQDRKVQGEYFSSGLAFLLSMFAVSAILFAIAQQTAVRLAVHNTFFDYIWLIYGIVISQILQQFFQQFTRSIDRMSVYGIAGIVQTALTAGLSFLMIPSYGVYGYIVAQISASILTSAYSLICSSSYRYLSWHSVYKLRCKEMLCYSMPLIPNGIMWWLVGALNRPIMEANVGLHGIGIFAVANKFPGILTMLFGIFATSWQISVMEEYGKEGFQVFYNKVFRALFLVVFVLYIMITLCSQPLIMLFTTPDFYEAWKYTPILTLGSLLSAMSGMGGMVFSAVRQSKYYFYSSVWGAVVAVVANLVFIPMFGIVGAGISVVLSFLAMAVSRIAYAWQYVHVAQLNRYLAMLIVSTLSAASAFLLNNVWFYAANIGVLFAILFINRDLSPEFIKLTKKIHL